MNKNIKIILAVIVGLMFWGVFNFASTALLGVLWPALGSVGRAAMESGDFSHLTLLMLLLFLAMWTWVNVGTGWLTMFIAKSRTALWCVLAALTAFALYNHAYVYWNNLPNWYNIAVIIIFPPTTYLGCLLVKH